LQSGGLDGASAETIGWPEDLRPKKVHGGAGIRHRETGRGFSAMLPQGLEALAMEWKWMAMVWNL